MWKRTGQAALCITAESTPPPVSYEYAEAYRQSVIEAWKDDDFASRYANLKVKPNGTVDF